MKKLFITFTMILGLTLFNSFNYTASAHETEGCFYYATVCGWEGWVCLAEDTSAEDAEAITDQIESDFCGQE